MKRSGVSWVMALVVAQGSAALGAPERATPTSPPALEVRFVNLTGKGIELRPVLRRLKTAEAAVRACLAPPAVFALGALRVSVQFAKQAIVKVEVTGPAAAGIADCVSGAVRRSGLEPGAGPAVLSATAVIRAPRDESTLPALRDDEALQVQDDASCQGMTSFPCAPHKDCMAPVSRPVRCPDEPPVAARQPLGDRRLVLAVSGGKSGQLGERIILADGGAQCVLVVMVNVGAGADPLDTRAEQREDVDLPCAKARAVLALAGRLGLSKLRAPKADSNAHEVGHQWELWRPTKGVAPIVATGGWTGMSAKADAVFATLAQALGGLVRDYATLQTGRLAP